MLLFSSVLSTSALCTLAGNANLGLPVQVQSTSAWSWSNASVPARTDWIGSRHDEQPAEQVKTQPAQPFTITASPGVPEEVNVTAIFEGMIASCDRMLALVEKIRISNNLMIRSYDRRAAIWSKYLSSHINTTQPAHTCSIHTAPTLPKQPSSSYPVCLVNDTPALSNIVDLPADEPALGSTDVMDPVDDGAFVRLSVFGTLVAQLTFGPFMDFIPLPAQVFVSAQVGMLYSMMVFTARDQLYQLRDRWAERRSLTSPPVPVLPTLPTLSAVATAPAYANITMEAPVFYAAPVLPAYIPTASVVELAPAQFEELVAVPEPIRPGPQSPSWRFPTISPNEPLTCSADDVPKSVIVWDPRSFDVENTHAPVQSLQDDMTAASGAPSALDLAGLVWVFVLAIIALKRRARIAAGVMKTIVDAFAHVFPAEASPICHQCAVTGTGNSEVSCPIDLDQEVLVWDNCEINLSIVEDLVERDDDTLSATDFAVVKDNETTTILDFESATTVTVDESSASCEPPVIHSSDIVEVEVAPSFEIIKGYLFEQWRNEAIREELHEEVYRTGDAIFPDPYLVMNDKEPSLCDFYLPSFPLDQHAWYAPILDWLDQNDQWTSACWTSDEESEVEAVGRICTEIVTIYVTAARAMIEELREEVSRTGDAIFPDPDLVTIDKRPTLGDLCLPCIPADIHVWYEPILNWLDVNDDWTSACWVSDEEDEAEAVARVTTGILAVFVAAVYIRLRMSSIAAEGSSDVGTEAAALETVEQPTPAEGAIAVDPLLEPIEQATLAEVPIAANILPDPGEQSTPIDSESPAPEAPAPTKAPTPVLKAAKRHKPRFKRTGRGRR
ncbi:hypothetical protein DXG01_003629 [Tephrocybe rancida]|nr:hypothetical protein DXG01_003629 [Tephrocybe rancida]